MERILIRRKSSLLRWFDPISRMPQIVCSSSSSCMCAAVQTNSTWSSTHLVLLTSGAAGLPGSSDGEGCYNRRFYDWPTAPQRHRCIRVCLACLSGTGMCQSGRCQFLVYSALPTDYGIALSQTGDKRQGWPKSGPVAWHFPMPLSTTPGYWSRSWSAPQHGGRRGVVNAGAVCQETVHYGQGCEGIA